jgi:hypothetical protein
MLPTLVLFAGIATVCRLLVLLPTLLLVLLPVVASAGIATDVAAGIATGCCVVCWYCYRRWCCRLLVLLPTLLLSSAGIATDVGVVVCWYCYQRCCWYCYRLLFEDLVTLLICSRRPTSTAVVVFG